jgi:hypothetical protein
LRAAAEEDLAQPGVEQTKQLVRVERNHHSPVFAGEDAENACKCGLADPQLERQFVLKAPFGGFDRPTVEQQHRPLFASPDCRKLQDQSRLADTGDAVNMSHARP